MYVNNYNSLSQAFRQNEIMYPIRPQGDVLTGGGVICSCLQNPVVKLNSFFADHFPGYDVMFQ